MGFNASALTEKTIKNFVDRLHKQNIATTPSYKRSQTQENVAVMLGYKNWHALQQAIATPKYPSNSKFAHAHQLIHGFDHKRCEFLSTLVNNTTHPTLVVHGELSVPVPNHLGAHFSKSSELIGNILSQIDFDTMSAEDMYGITKNFLPHNVGQNTLIFIQNLLNFLVTLRDDPQCKQSFNESTIAKYFEFEVFRQQIWRRDIPPKALTYIAEHLQCLGIPEDYIKYPPTGFNVNQEFLDVFEHKRRHKEICAPLKPLFFETRTKIFTSAKSVQIIEPSIDDPTLQSYIHWWCHTHPGGVLIVDGLASTSPLYAVLLNSLTFMKSHAIAMILGTATPHDFPTLQLYEQIKARVGEVITLEN